MTNSQTSLATLYDHCDLLKNVLHDVLRLEVGDKLDDVRCRCAVYSAEACSSAPCDDLVSQLWVSLVMYVCVACLSRSVGACRTRCTEWFEARMSRTVSVPLERKRCLSKNDMHRVFGQIFECPAAG